MRKFLEKAFLLKNLPRSGWLQSDVGLRKVEDVADHSFEVALAAGLMADVLSEKGYKLDKEKVLKGALVHDLHECLLTDQPRKAKEFFAAGSVRKAEGKAIDKLLGGLPASLKKRWRVSWEGHFDGSIEAKIIKAADNYVMVLQAEAYKKAGHRDENLERILKSGRDGVKKAVREFPELGESLT